MREAGTGMLRSNVVGKAFIRIGLMFSLLLSVLAFVSVVEQRPSLDEASLAILEVRYDLPEAGEVYLLWGINGWITVPAKIRPPGTVVNDRVMHTPMVREGDTFVTTVQVPTGSSLDYGFQIRKTRSGADITWVWDGDYQTSFLEDKVIEVKARRPVVNQVVSGDANVDVPWFSSVFLAGIFILVGVAVTNIWCFYKRISKKGGMLDLRGAFTYHAHQKAVLSRLTSGNYRVMLFNGCAFLFFALFTVAITCIYLSHENSFYYWDYASYHDMTVAKVVYFRGLPSNSVVFVLNEVVKGIWESTARDYSDLHTLLVVPFILLFGSSRLVYILTIAFLYFLPFTFIVGAIATRLVPSRPRNLVFWSAALLALLLPATWLPTLRGYPDTISATLIALAILIYLKDLRLQRSWQIVLIGLCITLAILIRRHFIYAGITFFSTISVQALVLFAVEVRKRAPEAWHNLLVTSVRIGLTVVSFLTTLILLGWPFVERVTHTNFGLLYASYAVPFNTGFQHYQSYYGWTACALAVIGFMAAMKAHGLSRPVTGFILLFSTFSALQWLLVVKQLGIHYTLHFTLGIILGLTAFIWVVWTSLKRGTRLLVTGMMAVYVTMNFITGLSSVDVLDYIDVAPPTKQALRRFFAANYPPLNRNDHSELVRLIDYLHKVASPDDPIYTAASSFVLSDDHLWHGQHIRHEPVISYPVEEFWRSSELNILRWVPFADSRDAYPLELLLQSQYVVVATPIQYHLTPDEQQVLKVVVDTFTENWELAQDFSLLPQQFFLADNVTVSVYKRVRSTSLATTLHTLQAMQDYMEERPGGQFDLINVSATSTSYITEKSDGSYDISVDVKTSHTSFLYVDQVTDRTVAEGRLDYYDTHCISHPTLSVDIVDENGRLISSTQLVQPVQEDNAFSHSLRLPKSAYLLLSISTDYDPGSADTCWLVLKDLTITNQPK